MVDFIRIRDISDPSLRKLAESLDKPSKCTKAMMWPDELKCIKRDGDWVGDGILERKEASAEDWAKITGDPLPAPAPQPAAPRTFAPPPSEEHNDIFDDLTLSLRAFGQQVLLNNEMVPAGGGGQLVANVPVPLGMPDNVRFGFTLGAGGFAGGQRNAWGVDGGGGPMIAFSDAKDIVRFTLSAPVEYRFEQFNVDQRHSIVVAPTGELSFSPTSPKAPVGVSFGVYGGGFIGGAIVESSNLSGPTGGALGGGTITLRLPTGK